MQMECIVRQLDNTEAGGSNSYLPAAAAAIERLSTLIVAIAYLKAGMEKPFHLRLESLLMYFMTVSEEIFILNMKGRDKRNE
eukprot:4215406-Ditylum_brightwellii.AAC.1